MEKLFTLIGDLSFCYEYKSGTIEGFDKLSNFQKSEHCKGVRNELMRHLQSNDLDFPNLIKERIATIESI